MKTNYKYLAFISYKREDEQWAKWLQHKLEHYKLPTSVRKIDPTLPERVRPVFKDTTDLAGGVLEKAIKKALDASKYLIVICSPRAAQSPWVCKEVQEFIDSGREEFIIPFIVEGEPNSRDEAKECFPRNLRDLSGERELLGININEMGRDAAAIKVVARMFKLQFDVLWQRWEREQRTRRRWIVGLSLLGVMVAFSIVGIMYSQHRKMQKNQARAVAQRATQLVEEGDSYLARKLLVEVLPDEDDLIPRPYVPEAEAALRLACENETMTVQGFYTSISQDSKYIISTGLYKNIKIWNISNGKCTKTLEGHTDWVAFAHFNHDGSQIVSVSRDNTVKVWDVETGKCIKTLEGHTNSVNSANFSPDGKYIVSASDDNTIKVWDVENGECIKTLEGHTNSVNSANFSPDGKYIFSASDDGTVKVWSVKNEEPIIIIDDDIDIDIYCYHLSPDGKYYAIWDEGYGVKIYDAENEECVKTLDGHLSFVMFANFNSDGKYIASASQDRTIKVWNVATGKCIKTLVGHTDTVMYADFSPDGKYIVSTSVDETVKVWNVITGKCIKTFEGLSGPIIRAYFTNDGKYIIYLGTDYIIAWKFEPLQDLIDQVKLQFKDNPLTDEERREYYME